MWWPAQINQWLNAKVSILLLYSMAIGTHTLSPLKINANTNSGGKTMSRYKIIPRKQHY